MYKLKKLAFSFLIHMLICMYTIINNDVSWFLELLTFTFVVCWWPKKSNLDQKKEKHKNQSQKIKNLPTKVGREVDLCMQRASAYHLTFVGI
jgi:hypothetical protein